MTTALSNSQDLRRQDQLKRAIKMLFDAHREQDPFRIREAMRQLEVLHYVDTLADAAVGKRDATGERAPFCMWRRTGSTSHT